MKPNPQNGQGADGHGQTDGPEEAIRRHGILAWFAANPVVANLMMVTIIGAGVFSASRIRKEAFPAFSAESVVVTVPFRGGTPEDVEKGVAIKIEESMEGIEGIEQIRSVSTENSAVVTVEARENYDLQKLLDDVKIKVDSIPSFPEQIENPVITEGQVPNHVMWVDVYGEVGERVLKETARDLRDRLLTLDDVSEVKTFGARDYEMSIEVSEDRLRAYGLTFAEVAQAVSRESLDLSGGVVRSQQGEITLRSKNQAYTAADFAALPVRTVAGGGTITVGEVADVRDGFVDQEVLGRFNGKPSVSMEVTNKGRDDIVKASQGTRRVIEAMRPELPEGVSVEQWVDESKTIASRLELLAKNGLAGVALVALVLALFLNVRLAFWVALGIPISVAGAVVLLPFAGDLSLNVLSSFAFIVALGIIVDDAIVIGESVFAEKSRSGDNTLNTTMRGVGRVVVPAAFGVLTTVAAFMPLVMVTGRMGQAFSQIGMVVILCLLFSLVESKLILPAHLVHVDVQKRYRNPVAWVWRKIQQAVNGTLMGFIRFIYQPVLRLAIKFRYATVALFVLFLVWTGVAVSAGLIKRQFFPDISLETVAVNVEVEQGVPVSRLHEILEEVEEALKRVDQSVVDNGGQKMVVHSLIQANSNDRGSVIVELTAGDERAMSTSRLKRVWREAVGPVAGSKSVIFSNNAGPPGDALVLRLAGKELESLRTAAVDMAERIRIIEGVFDVRDTFNSGKPEIGIELTRAGQAALIDRRTLAMEVRDAYFGREAQRVQRGRDEVRVMVRYPIEDRESLEGLRNMRIRGPNGQSLPFDVVATLSYKDGLAKIDRANGERVVDVQAEVEKEIVSSEEVVAQVKSWVPEFEAANPGVRVLFEGQAQQRTKSLGSLMQGFVIALVMIYILLAIPLKSYVKPFIVMSVIPFGIIGAVVGHWIVNIPVSILSMFGIVALSGVVVNDSLVYLCAVDERRRNGVPLREALLTAGMSRFRPILLTSITTFVGLAPLLLETETQAQFLIPMAVSLAFGILFVTPITLILLPMLYLIGNDVSRVFKGFFGLWNASKTAPVEKPVSVESLVR